MRMIEIDKDDWIPVMSIINVSYNYLKHHDRHAIVILTKETKYVKDYDSKHSAITYMRYLIREIDPEVQIDKY